MGLNQPVWSAVPGAVAGDFLALHLVDITEVDARQLAAWRELLDMAEIARLAQLRRDDAARRFIVGRGVLRTMLAARLRCQPDAVVLQLEAGGRPVLRGDALRFSIAHSRERVAVAIGDCTALGIDIEYASARRDLYGIARAVFPAAELNRLERLPEAERGRRFYRNWTLSEALVKAEGRGIAELLHRPGRHLPSALFTGADDSDWRFSHWRLSGGYHLGLVTRDATTAALAGISRQFGDGGC